MSAQKTVLIPVKAIMSCIVAISLALLVILACGDPAAMREMFGEEITSREYSLVAYTAKACPELREKVKQHMSDGWIDRVEYDAIIREYCPGTEKENPSKDSLKVGLMNMLRDDANKVNAKEGHFCEF